MSNGGLYFVSGKTFLTSDSEGSLFLSIIL